MKSKTQNTRKMPEKKETCIINKFFVKNRDLRCSIGCVRNYTRYGSLPPPWLDCECTRNCVIKIPKEALTK